MNKRSGRGERWRETVPQIYTSAQPPSSSLYDASLSGRSGLSTSFATRSSARPDRPQKYYQHELTCNGSLVLNLFEETSLSRVCEIKCVPQWVLGHRQPRKSSSLQGQLSKDMQVM